MSAIWRVPRAVVREGGPLLDLLCFCWGEDIKRAEGNLLLEYGFIRERHATERDLSRYRKGALCLWAFGLFWSNPEIGGLWLLRQDFKARLAPAATPPDIWTVRDAPLHYPVTPAEGMALQRLLGEVIDEITAYERWVLATVGLAWRTERVRRWGKARIPAAELPQRWAALAEQVRVQ